MHPWLALRADDGARLRRAAFAQDACVPRCDRSAQPPASRPQRPIAADGHAPSAGSPSRRIARG